VFDLAFVISGDPFEATDGHGFFFDPTSTASGFARTVAGSTQNTRKYIGFPIHHIGFGVFFCRNQSYIFWYRRVRRTSILAIYDFVKILRICYVCGFHDKKYFECVLEFIFGVKYKKQAK
jgi:hypothetical protein